MRNVFCGGGHGWRRILFSPFLIFFDFLLIKLQIYSHYIASLFSKSQIVSFNMALILQCTNKTNYIKYTHQK